MARLPALVDAIAVHDWRPKSLIAHFGKTVRDTDLILSKKTGTAAVAMTYADAATLLMAVGGAHSPAGAKAAVEALRDMKPREIDRMKRADLAPELAFLRPNMTFGRTLETLIENAERIEQWERQYLLGEGGESGLSAAEFSMLSMTKKMAPLAPGYGKAVRVVFYPPGLAAEIHLGRMWLSLEEDNAFHETYFAAGDLLEVANKDILGTIEVGVPTLVALKRAVDAPNSVVKRPSKAEREARLSQ